jgi:hypothetical protein
VGIRPALIEDRLDPGIVKAYSISITNLNEIEQTFYLDKRDIVGVQPGGSPIFANPEKERTGLELSEWITLERPSITLQPGESQSVGFIMTVPEAVSPGGHFGGIVVSVQPPEMRSTGAAIGYEVANIISIRISGDAIDLARIRQFATDRYFHGDSQVKFDVKIENEGNTLVRPIGPIIVKNMLGSKVAQLDFNDSAAGVFPYTTRDFVVEWSSDNPGFGRYEASLAISYGDQGAMKSLNAVATFWIIPLNIVLPALGVLSLLFLIIYLTIRFYVRRKVALLTAGGSRRIIRQRSSGDFPVLLLVVSLLVVTALLLIILLALFA